MIKILEVYIIEFGILKNQTFRFDKPCIIANNGAGKTTLACFIKAMFYGFSKTKQGNKEERARYINNYSICGGNLIFSINDRIYRIERRFKKTNKEDTFKLYDHHTNLISYDYDEHIGEQLFSLDILSYCDSLFLNQNDLYTHGKSLIDLSIMAKVDYESLLSRIQDDLNELSPKRKNSKTTVLLNQIHLCHDKIADEYALIQEKDELYAKLNHYLNTNHQTNNLEYYQNKYPQGILKKSIILKYLSLKQQLPLYSKLLLLYALITIPILIPMHIVIKLIISMILLIIITIRVTLPYMHIRKTLDHVYKNYAYSLEEMLEDLEEIQRLKQSSNDDHIKYMHTLEARIEMIEEKLEEYAYIKGNIIQLQKEYDELYEQYEILKETKDYVIKTSDVLYSTYKDDIYKQFLYYFSLIKPDMQFKMDGYLDLYPLIQQQERPISDMSQGLQDLIYLCLRFALIDIIYKDKPLPPIILDDPLCNLDNDNLELAKKLIIELSKHYQVIYFTCVKERSI